MSIEAQRRVNLRTLLRPRNVAFVGGRYAENCIATCRDAGFEGEIWPVNPKYPALAGIACAPSLDALPRAPDATFIALSRERTIDTVRELAAMGAPGAVCHVTGYRELGAEQQAEM